MVGHIDHGKSTLIGRILFDTESISETKLNQIKAVCESLGKKFELAFLLDQLEEERQKGITIDTAQIFFKTPKREYVIIDAPGHAEFLKNMITGAALADAAILMIDAHEGIQEQTKRHAYVLKMLDIKNIIVCVNKMDRVDYSESIFQEISTKITEIFNQLGLTAKTIVPISALQGDNITKPSENLSWNQNKPLLEILDELQIANTDNNENLIFPIQDCFEDGENISLGRIENGQLTTNDQITILPENQTATIKEIKKWNEKITSAGKGESIGLTFTNNTRLHRGQIICHGDQSKLLHNELKIRLFWLAEKSFDPNKNYTLRIATQEVPCQIKNLQERINSSDFTTIETNGQTLEQNEVAIAEINLKKPAAADLFTKLPILGRCLLVDEEQTCAGGIVIE